MANPRNATSLTELREVMGDAKTFFLVDYQGLTAAEVGSLRKKIRGAGGRMLVAKNTLVNVVLKEHGIDTFSDVLQGPTALVLVGDDLVAPVKAITDYIKDHPKDLPVAKGGMLQGSKVAADAFERISKLPSREQIYSQLVGVLQAPLQQLVGVLEGPQRNLVGVLQNYSEKLKEGAGA
jgi:large subunit ribosomal protein L10